VGRWAPASSSRWPVKDTSELNLGVVDFVTAVHLRLVGVLRESVAPARERDCRTRLDALTAALRDTPELLRALMDSEAVVGEAEQAARETFDHAAELPEDDTEIECALAMARASDEARAAEAAARERWQRHQEAIESHLLELGRLVAIRRGRANRGRRRLSVGVLRR
jgi:uncharacterized protein HemY